MTQYRVHSISYLREFYREQSRYMKFKDTSKLFNMRIVECSSVNGHVLSMINKIEKLEHLDCNIDADVKTELILQLLPNLFKPFIVNFNMNKFCPTLSELLLLGIKYPQPKPPAESTTERHSSARTPTGAGLHLGINCW